MKFDEILVRIGEFGFFQKRIFFLLCLPTFLGSMGGLSVIFKLNMPLHRCSLGENDTYEIQDEYHSHLVNMSIPWETYRGERVMSSCFVYQNPDNGSYVTNETVKCDSWVYDKSIFKTTMTEQTITVLLLVVFCYIISYDQFSMVCDNRILRSHSNMVGFAGMLVGTLIMGILSDVFGRRPIFLISGITSSVAGIAVTFVPNIYVYMGLNFITALGGIASFTTSLVLVMELTGPSHRVFFGMVFEFFWCLGLFTLGLIAYFVRYWQTLNLIVSVPMIGVILLLWILPESPRWLVSRGRIQEAREVLKKIARVNGTEIETKILEEITFDETENKVRITKMLTSRSLRLMILIIFFNWFVVSMVYYGIGLNVQNLSGNIYLNFTISNIMEGASYTLCIVSLDRLGRKILHCACMLSGGLACLGTIFPVIYGTSAIDWVTVLLSMVGKFGAAGAFAILYVYTSELFPTVVRNSGIGISSFFGRIGGMVAPYIADLGVLIGGDLKTALPLIAFGGMSVAAGLLSLYLPETLGTSLPETIQDAINIRKSKTSTKYDLGGKDEGPNVKGDVKLESFHSFEEKRFE